MSEAYLTAVATRRSNYSLTPKSSISDEKLEAIVTAAVKHAPSPFNIQAGRAVLVIGAENTKLWELVKDYTAPGLEGEAREAKAAEHRLNLFETGYGSVLFFEDQAVIDDKSTKVPPTYAKHLPVWSTNATGMMQHVVWTAFTLEGLGASLQHNGAYSDELSATILKTFGLPSTWTSTAIMPFGVPGAPPGEKVFGPLEDRVKVFKA
ncbi:putative nitroreductase family protein [Mycena rebaudengoi]|nr:putative nitroreductase family protein [Mycena rebaudengoi]